VFLQLPANDLHELVGQDGDEQVAVNANFFMVVDRAQAEFGFETTEYGFQVGEHDIVRHKRSLSQSALVAAQAVDAGMGEPGAVLWLFGPTQFDHLFHPTRPAAVRCHNAD
jgi:hypothetical protein